MHIKIGRWKTNGASDLIPTNNRACEFEWIPQVLVCCVNIAFDQGLADTRRRDSDIINILLRDLVDLIFENAGQRIEVFDIPDAIFTKMMVVSNNNIFGAQSSHQHIAYIFFRGLVGKIPCKWSNNKVIEA